MERTSTSVTVPHWPKRFLISATVRDQGRLTIYSFLFWVASWVSCGFLSSVISCKVEPSSKESFRVVGCLWVRGDTGRFWERKRVEFELRRFMNCLGRLGDERNLEEEEGWRRRRESVASSAAISMVNI